MSRGSLSCPHTFVDEKPWEEQAAAEGGAGCGGETQERETQTQISFPLNAFSSPINACPTRNLSGSIPPLLADLNSLGYFDVSFNNFSGEITFKGHLVTFDVTSYRGNPLLCGLPTNKSCNLERSQNQVNQIGGKRKKKRKRTHAGPVNGFTVLISWFIIFNAARMDSSANDSVGQPKSDYHMIVMDQSPAKLY
ncbi:hypothetical protein F2Q70_00042865 [Brassica cretica]|uniref:Uncharacterized protein n=1 Tax=Brassica cretica TaxID=69181 RepID=A0A8S9KGI9_BRACR|nr:hypothetical protein F2Q70_00042865 [Brassica cretica]